MTESTDRKVFVEAGAPVGLIGGDAGRCRREGDALVVLPDERWGNPVFGDACLDEGDFHIHARLTLDRLTGSGASVLLGGHYHYNWSRPEGNCTFRICLDEYRYPARKSLTIPMQIVHGMTDPHRPWFPADDAFEKKTVGKCLDFFRPGEPFTLDISRRGSELNVAINDRDVFRHDLADDSRIPAGRCGDPGWPVSVGFLPGRGTVRIHDFRAEGSFPGPAFPATDAWRMNSDDYSLYRIPSLCMSPGGRLLAFCEARRSYRSRGWEWNMSKGMEFLSGEIHCAMKSSDDQGQTWAEQMIIPPLTCGATYEARDPSPLPDLETGEIFLFTRGPWVTSSRDDGRTWSEARSLSSSLPGDWASLAAGTGNSALQLRQGRHKGRLLASLYGSGVIALVLSDDHGKTWRPGALLASNTASEPSVAELSDGRVLVSPRHGLGKARGRLFLFSDDGGQSFSEKRYEPGIPIAGQGEILASELLGLGGAGTVRPIVCCGPAENKTRLTLMASLDDGRTWPVSRVLDDGSAANLALVALPGGEVGVLYERDKYRRLSFQRVDLAALIASR